MNTKARFVLIFALVLLGGVALAAVTWAMPGSASAPPAPGEPYRPASFDLAQDRQGGAPTVVSYQGEVWVSDAPYTGTGYFKFAVVNTAEDTTYWSNDGSSTVGDPPTAAVGLTVSNGLFSVLLGDTTLDGMTQTLTAEVFGEPDRTLRVWFSTSAGSSYHPAS